MQYIFFFIHIICPFTEIQCLVSSMMHPLLELNTFWPAADRYMFSLSYDDCSSCCCCLFDIISSDADESKPRSLSTCADCLRRMMLRGVLEPRGGAAKLRGASGDL